MAGTIGILEGIELFGCCQCWSRVPPLAKSDSDAEFRDSCWHQKPYVLAAPDAEAVPVAEPVAAALASVLAAVAAAEGGGSGLAGIAPAPGTVTTLGITSCASFVQLSRSLSDYDLIRFEGADLEVSAHPLMTAFKRYNSDRPLIFKRRMPFLLVGHVAPTDFRGGGGGGLFRAVYCLCDNPPTISKATPGDLDIVSSFRLHSCVETVTKCARSE